MYFDAMFSPYPKCYLCAKMYQAEKNLIINDHIIYSIAPNIIQCTVKTECLRSKIFQKTKQCNGDQKHYSNIESYPILHPSVLGGFHSISFWLHAS